MKKILIGLFILNSAFAFADVPINEFYGQVEFNQHSYLENGRSYDSSSPHTQPEIKISKTCVVKLDFDHLPSGENFPRPVRLNKANGPFNYSFGWSENEESLRITFRSDREGSTFDGNQFLMICKKENTADWDTVSEINRMGIVTLKP